jgi:hypothetical protein
MAFVEMIGKYEEQKGRHVMSGESLASMRLLA